MDNAMALFEAIPTGGENPLYVENRNTGFRNLVREANLNGDVIINTGNGYYRPDLGNEADKADYEHYIAREISRAKELFAKVHAMQAAVKAKEA